MYARCFSAVLLALLALASSLRAQEPHLVAYAGFAGFQAPVWAPKDLGLFTKYGFNGDVVLVPGSVRQIQAIVGGSIHLAQADAGRPYSILTGAIPMAKFVIDADRHIMEDHKDLEAGAGWVPFIMDRMEEDYEKFAARLAPHLKSPPSKFFKSGNIFFTMEVAERTAPYIPELVHPDVIMWASDFPHERERDQFGGDLPHLMARKDLSDEFKRKMLYDNPARFFRFSEGDIAAVKKAKGN
jgi:hypothetical protein